MVHSQTLQVVTDGLSFAIPPPFTPTSAYCIDRSKPTFSVYRQPSFDVSLKEDQSTSLIAWPCSRTACTNRTETYCLIGDIPGAIARSSTAVVSASHCGLHYSRGFACGLQTRSTIAADLPVCVVSGHSGPADLLVIASQSTCRIRLMFVEDQFIATYYFVFLITFALSRSCRAVEPRARSLIADAAQVSYSAKSPHTHLPRQGICHRATKVVHCSKVP